MADLRNQRPMPIDNRIIAIVVGVVAVMVLVYIVTPRERASEPNASNTINQPSNSPGTSKQP